MDDGEPAQVARLVCKRASAAADVEHRPTSQSTRLDQAAIRRETEVLARCEVGGIVQLVAYGERPVPWMETADAGPHNMAAPPRSPNDRLAALAALARVLAHFHDAGWAHLSLDPSHVIWREVAAASSSDAGSHGGIVVTLCSLGSAVCPAGPTERYADREALATIMATALTAPGAAALTPDLRTALSAVAGDLRSGDLDDLAAAGAALDDLAGAARRADGTRRAEGGRWDNVSSLSGDKPPQRARSPLRSRNNVAATMRRLTKHRSSRVALMAATVLLGLGGTAALAARSGTPDRPEDGTPAGADEGASTDCAQPQVPSPRVDPDRSGCGERVAYRSSVLTIGTAQWSLGAGIIDGRLVDLDDDGWSELVTLRADGEVFLVRRFPVDASHPVKFRSVATARGARRLVGSTPGAGLDGMATIAADGTTAPLVPTPAGFASFGSAVTGPHPAETSPTATPRVGS